MKSILSLVLAAATIFTSTTANPQSDIILPPPCLNDLCLLNPPVCPPGEIAAGQAAGVDADQSAVRFALLRPAPKSSASPTKWLIPPHQLHHAWGAADLFAVPFATQSRFYALNPSRLLGQMGAGAAAPS
ncbi:LOW QUALITY PROTEIN: hypothetical protein CVT26_013207 [Gymnopilus dilepis]|uniref:Uncharacterized protein n=1 Tax=Gymnopilus dilepis TaxID=231916 RepID=A0A409VWJ6_9AGAR|nr:LOW QUALITY PROTEIN: hypothetical protein CVT26_013207 [Gymnopilus dilepis]